MKDMFLKMILSRSGIENMKQCKKHHTHFEVYDQPIKSIGKIIENTAVEIIRDSEK